MTTLVARLFAGPADDVVRAGRCYIPLVKHLEQVAAFSGLFF